MCLSVIISSVIIITFAITLGKASTTRNFQTNIITDTNKFINKVDIKIIIKDFLKEDFEEQEIIDLELINKTRKDIMRIQGTISFFAPCGKVISNHKIFYDKGISANSKKTWRANLPYKEFIGINPNVEFTTSDTIKYSWRVDSIVYMDNSVETF